MVLQNVYRPSPSAQASAKRQSTIHTRAHASTSILSSMIAMTIKSVSMYGLLTLAAFAVIAAAQGPCSVDKDCPQPLREPQICANARCMPKDCTFKGCQSFHKGTYCIARQCQPRLTENATCTWDPRANFATREQPCEAGLVCSGNALSAKCVRNGPGPTDFSGKPEFPDLAAQSASEKKDESIPPRPAINPKEPSAENPGSGLEWWHYTFFGVFGVAFVFVVTMALKDRRFVLRSAKELVEARKQKLAAETAAALAQVHNKPVVAQSGQAGLAAPASLTEQPGQQGSNSGQAGTVLQIPIEEYLALQEHRQRQQQSAGPAVVSPLASRQNEGQR